VTVAVVWTALAVGGAAGEAHYRSGTSVVDTHPSAAAYALIVVAGAALVWRRRWPLPVLAVATAGVTAWSAAGFVNGAPLLLPIVALYTLASVTPRRTNARTAIAAGAVVLVALGVSEGAAAPLGWIGGPNTTLPFEVATAVGIGFTIAARREHLAAVQERAVRAEETREHEARRRVDAERLRIARELHDVVAHSMAMINVQAGVAAHVIDTRPQQAAQALTAIKAASKEGLRELRAILNVLRQADEPDTTSPAPGLTQLDSLVSATRQAGLPVELERRGTGAALPAAVDLAAYRIVQESLTNVLRHAGPTPTTVCVDHRPGRLLIDVTDAGGAGPPSESTEGAGTGIRGMRERAEALGGMVVAAPRAAGGFSVHAELPLEPSGSGQSGKATGPAAGVASARSTGP
jgi:signal transduction histidine kinase